MSRGAALPSVLLALGLVAALVVGGAFITRRWSANESAVASAASPDSDTEAAIAGTLSGLDSAFLVTLPERATAIPGVVTAGPSGQSIGRVWITRLDPQSCLVTAETVISDKHLQSNRLSVLLDCSTAPVRPLHGRPWMPLH